LSYYFAHALVFGPASDSAGWHLFLTTLPIAIALKLAALLASGIYRGLWRYANLSDVFTYGRGVALGSAATIVYVSLRAGRDAVTLSVFVVDAMLLLLAVTASRLAFRLLRRLFRTAQEREGRRVVIYGATDGGELLLRQLHFNTGLLRVPVAFLDADPRKAGRFLHGLPIGSAADAKSIASFCRDHGAEELLIAASVESMPSMRDILAECSYAGVAVSRMNIDIRDVIADQQV
jgi:UDP-GlcNAc:undecaprenyl-phosphate GlcNAc-1-phosphate transferase